jgi:hypothetical protein
MSTMVDIRLSAVKRKWKFRGSKICARASHPVAAPHADERTKGAAPKADLDKTDGDRRRREAILTRKGNAATDAVDVAREGIALTLFEGWSHRDFDELVRLMRMAADRLNETPAGQLE